MPTDTVLITGGLGYLGGRISHFLSGNTGRYLKIATRRKVKENPDWLAHGEIVRFDLMSDKDLRAACNGTQSIIHLAALNEIECDKDPEQAFIVNSLCTLRLLRAAQRAGVERFLYFSTAHVYGAPLRGAITEETLPRPVHPYAITHKAAEDFILAAHDSKDILGIVLRLSNGFGAPMDANVNRWSLVVNDLCRQAVKTGKLVLRSSGRQKRDFITLFDVSRAVEHFLNLPEEECGDGLFNLGGEYSIMILEMAQIISESCLSLLNFKPEILCQAPQPNETSDHFHYCIDKIKSTGFEPTRNIKQEIESTLLFCKKRILNLRG